MKKINLYLMMALMVGSVAQSSDNNQTSDYDQSEYVYTQDDMNSTLDYNYENTVRYGNQLYGHGCCNGFLMGYLFAAFVLIHEDYLSKKIDFISEKMAIAGEFTKSELAILAQGAAQTETWKNLENSVSLVGSQALEARDAIIEAVTSNCDKAVDFVNENQLAVGLAVGAVSAGILMKYALSDSSNDVDQEAQYMYSDEILEEMYPDFHIGNESFAEFKEFYIIV